MDRQRLRKILELATEVLSDQTTRVIESKVQSLPTTLRPLVRGMAGQLQIRSMISVALTRLDEELSDDEWRSLLHLIAQTALDVSNPDRIGPTGEARREAQPAIDHLMRVLSE